MFEKCSFFIQNKSWGLYEHNYFRFWLVYKLPKGIPGRILINQNFDQSETIIRDKSFKKQIIIMLIEYKPQYNKQSQQ